MKAVRWSDNDSYFWRFTYSKGEHDKWSLMLGSGCPDYPKCRLRLSGFKRTLIIALPPILKPWKKWVDTSKYEWSKSESGGFWDVFEREYGFTITEGSVHTHYGAQTHDSDSTKSKVWFMPWRSWRHVRHSCYDLEGNHHYTASGDLRFCNPEYEVSQKMFKECPNAIFEFFDYDGEKINATCRIEEREWRLGEGKFKWLSWFRKPRVERYMDIRFSSEVGKRKGSWKGGTIGHSTDVLENELHESAFKRYCQKQGLKYVHSN